MASELRNGVEVRRLSFEVLGVHVDALELPEACRTVREWIEHRRGCRYVALTGMHGIMEAQHDPAFKCILNAADLVVPDGTPKWHDVPLRQLAFSSVAPLRLRLEFQYSE